MKITNEATGFIWISQVGLLGAQDLIGLVLKRKVPYPWGPLSLGQTEIINYAIYELFH